MMFIREQMMTYREARMDFVDDELIDRHVWSPVACRHCCWMFVAKPYGKRLWG